MFGTAFDQFSQWRNMQQPMQQQPGGMGIGPMGAGGFGNPTSAAPWGGGFNRPQVPNYNLGQPQEPQMLTNQRGMMDQYFGNMPNAGQLPTAPQAGVFNPAAQGQRFTQHNIDPGQMGQILPNQGGGLPSNPDMQQRIQGTYDQLQQQMQPQQTPVQGMGDMQGIMRDQMGQMGPPPQLDQGAAAEALRGAMGGMRNQAQPGREERIAANQARNLQNPRNPNNPNHPRYGLEKGQPPPQQAPPQGEEPWRESQAPPQAPGDNGVGAQAPPPQQPTYGAPGPPPAQPRRPMRRRQDPRNATYGAPQQQPPTGGGGNPLQAAIQRAMGNRGGA